MKSVDCSPMYMPFMCGVLQYSPTSYAQTIVCLDDGLPIAGVIYDCYNTVGITAHLWIAEGKVPSREWYCAIFDYPFNRLKVKKISGQVASGNRAACELDEHMGFVKEAVIKDYVRDGDLIIYTMTREQCKILNSPLWKSALKKVEAA